MSAERLSVAVIGGGVAGLSAALLISEVHDVTLFESNHTLGGHTNTIIIPDGPDKGLPIDTGFIVLNDRTYPVFERFLKRLGVETRDSDMSFGFHCEASGLQYAGTGLWGLFADVGNVLNLSYLKMLREIGEFNRSALKDLELGKLRRVPLRDYLREKRVSEYTILNYLVPMGAAIWSSPDAEMLSFPAETFVRFFAQHGLLTLQDRPQWKTVVGGSFRYVRAFEKIFPGTFFIEQPVMSVGRDQSGARLRFASGEQKFFDKVVIATHADQALSLLEDPSQEEVSLLGAWRYQKNHTVLHTDESVLPPNRSAWASWNYTREASSEGENPVSVTYHMNRLQGIHSNREYCVTLNRHKSISPERVIKEIDYTHPVYSAEAVNSQEYLRKLSGTNNTFYCGSYFGYGFHEDAVKSGVEVANHFGVSL